MKLKLRYSLQVIAISMLSLVIGACTNQTNSSKKDFKAIDKANMDTTIAPGKDFFRYASGNWMKKHPIPAEFSRYGAFEQLEEENQKKLKELFTTAANNKSAAKGSNQQKIGDFYSSGLDTVKIEANSYKPIVEDLANIDKLTNTEELIKYIANMQLSGMSPLFSIYAAPDDKNSNKVIAQFYQGGLGLGDRDYYLNTDARSKTLREEYLKLITKMFEFTGVTPEIAKSNADAIMTLETKIAKVSRTRLELRDPQTNYNKMDLEQLNKLAPNFNWTSYFSTIGISATNELNIGQPNFISGINKLYKEVSLDQWKIYLKWNLINSSADYLSSNFVKENFHFYGTVFSGKEKMKDRWKKVLEETSSSLGEAVGKLYVEKYFPAEAKKKMLDLVNNLKLALKDRIQALEWMSEPTKKLAIEKLEKMNVKVGYPDKWIDYSSVTINRDSYYKNVMAANRFNVKRELNKIGKPVDRSEWGMTPQTVNAYYNPNMNEIVFPAAILQYPFFDLASDDAVNYGAIGVVIGHEMTHGFDDQGRQYDKDGNLVEWWTPEDATKFKEHVQVLVTQFNNYKILDSLHVDGELTLGENIADLGGIMVSYTALQKAMKLKPQTEKIDGFTANQRFFLSFAQIWRCNVRDKESMRRLKEDVHSPAEARVNGALPNVPYFYEAFNIKPGDALYRPEGERAKVW
jgi:putative endopeptidase